MCVRAHTPVGREGGMVIQLLKTDRSNRSTVTEFSLRLEGITVKCRGHRGRLALDNYTQSGLCVCACMSMHTCVCEGRKHDLYCSQWAK